MTIERLASGSYRAVMMIKGKRYRITYPYKPTKKQAEADLYELSGKDPTSSNKELTFNDASTKYIETKRNVLSPSTIRNYIKINENLPEWFLLMKIDTISQVELNKLINELCVNRSPKTIRNYHGFISAVMGTFRPQFKICTTLPQKRKIEPYIPTDDEVKRILDEIKGTKYYIPIVLACYGMRRGEIIALTPEDLDGNVIHINKALSINDKSEYVQKSTKTTESERDILIPDEIADMIREQGYVYNDKPDKIYQYLSRVQKRLGIEHFPLHKLRHYFVSKMLTITDAKTVQALGGWKTDNVMKTVYAHSLKEEQNKAKKAAVDMFSSSIL